MDSRKVKLTKQMAKAITITEQECQRTNNKTILPGHLLIGCLEQCSYTVKEAILDSSIHLNTIRGSLESSSDDQVLGFNYEPFNLPVSLKTKQILDEAIGFMRGYKQIYLNEGHVLNALVESGYVDGLLNKEQKLSLLRKATVSRDMLMDLTDYSCPELTYKNIRKVCHADFEKLIQFVENEFSGRWTNSIKNGFDKNDPSIFIALDSEGDIIGFAAFNVSEKQGYFGPMGVAIGNRSEGIGYSLLHHCLKDMKMLGYTEIIIGGAGPIEFYERACSARVVPNGQ